MLTAAVLFSTASPVERPGYLFALTLTRKGLILTRKTAARGQTVAKTNAEHQKAHRIKMTLRKQTARQLIDANPDHVKIRTALVAGGKRRVTFDFHADLYAAIDAECTAKGFTVDDLLTDVISETMARYTKGKVPQIVPTDKHLRGK